MDQYVLHPHQVMAKFGLDPFGEIPADTPYPSKVELRHKSPDAPPARESATPSLVGNG